MAGWDSARREKPKAVSFSIICKQHNMGRGKRKCSQILEVSFLDFAAYLVGTQNWLAVLVVASDESTEAIPGRDHNLSAIICAPRWNIDTAVRQSGVPLVVFLPSW